MHQIKILTMEERKKILGRIVFKQDDKTVAPRCPGPCPLNPCRIAYKQYKMKVG